MMSLVTIELAARRLDSLAGIASGNAAIGAPRFLGTKDVFEMPTVGAGGINMVEEIDWDKAQKFMTTINETTICVALIAAGNSAANLNFPPNGTF